MSEIQIDVGRRVRLTTRPTHHAEAFAADVRQGLSATPKVLSCQHLYDARGSALFERICELPEYYLTRAEREILSERVGELISLLPQDVSVLELGSGSGVKTRILLEALLRRRRTLRYSPIDISRSALEESSLELADSYDALEIDGFVGEYRDGLVHFGQDESEPWLVLWLGSSIGNLHRQDAVEFLRELRENLLASDFLLVGIDLRKDVNVLERAYDDSRGVTADFNKNLLARINRELGGSFDQSRFRHRATYLHEIGRVEMHLVSECAQRVRLAELDLDVSFERGESIHTENSYKYSIEEIDELAGLAGFERVARWFDENRWFSLNLFTPA